MAASNNNGGSGMKFFYSISYGKLTTRKKDIPEGSSEINLVELKQKIQSVEKVDLRNKYINKGTGDYPYLVFYDEISGVINSVEKKENDHGVFLNINMTDQDGDDSTISTDFYGKSSENFLNRYLNTDGTGEFRLFPYSIPNSGEINGETKKFYTQGVSLKQNGNKVEVKYDNENKELPATEQVTVKGKTTTSRDKRIDFLYSKLGEVPAAKTQLSENKAQGFYKPPVKVDEDSLPF